jgi:hypothetical protein
MNIKEILAGFEISDGEYKLKEVEAALEQKEEIIPHLIALLEKVRDEPSKYTGGSGYYAHVYALMLLGYWREAKAQQVIIDLVSLPKPLPEDLFGDIIVEHLPEILLRTCGGSVEKIKELITNKNADAYSREAAITAISYAVLEGFITREDALSYFAGFFSADAAPEDSFFYSQLAWEICDLYPEELIDTIRGAYERELIDDFVIGIEDFQIALDCGKEQCLEDFRKKASNRSLDDFHRVMQSWTCFDDETIKPSIPKKTNQEFFAKPAPKPKKKKEFWDL